MSSARNTQKPRVTSAFRYCPHCGGRLGDDTFPQHMAQECEEVASPSREAVSQPPDPQGEYRDRDDLPLLEETSGEIDVGEQDLTRRRDLADQLAAEDVWPE